MLQALILKKAADLAINVIAKKFKLKKLQEYVEKDNELDVQMRVQQKTSDKHGKALEEVQKDIAILKKNSHAPKDFICMECGCKAKKNNK
tara:strand:+ start:258 stop:527 length:270 start_codon:yes stop_codon:yes gene_type:complete